MLLGFEVRKRILWNLGGAFECFRNVFESSKPLGKGLKPWNSLLKGVNAIFEDHKNCSNYKRIH